MSKEIKELLERANITTSEFLKCWPRRESMEALQKDIDQALALLKLQPTVGKFTKIAKRVEAINKDLLEACETAEIELEQRYKAQDGSPVDKVALKIIKAAIAKAKQGGD